MEPGIYVGCERPVSRSAELVIRWLKTIFPEGRIYVPNPDDECEKNSSQDALDVLNLVQIFLPIIEPRQEEYVLGRKFAKEFGHALTRIDDGQANFVITPIVVNGGNLEETISCLDEVSREVLSRKSLPKSALLCPGKDLPSKLKPIDYKLLALSTMCGGFDQLELSNVADSLEITNPATLPIDRHLKFVALRSASVFMPLAPPHLGQYWILHFLGTNFEANLVDTAKLSRVAWDLKPQGMAKFIVDASSVFDNPNIKLLLNTCGDSAESRIAWCFAVADITEKYINANVLDTLQGLAVKTREILVDFPDEPGIDVAASIVELKFLARSIVQGDTSSTAESYAILKERALQASDTNTWEQLAHAANLILMLPALALGPMFRNSQCRNVYEDLLRLTPNQDNSEKLSEFQLTAAKQLVTIYGESGYVAGKERVLKSLGDLIKTRPENVRIVECYLECVTDIIRDRAHYHEEQECEARYRDLICLYEQKSEKFDFADAVSENSLSMVYLYNELNDIPNMQKCYRTIANLLKDKSGLRLKKRHASAGAALIKALSNDGQISKAKLSLAELQKIIDEGDRDGSLLIQLENATLDLLDACQEAGNKDEIAELKSALKDIDEELRAIEESYSKAEAETDGNPMQKLLRKLEMTRGRGGSSRLLLQPRTVDEDV